MHHRHRHNRATPLGWCTTQCSDLYKASQGTLTHHKNRKMAHARHRRRSAQNSRTTLQPAGTNRAPHHLEDPHTHPHTHAHPASANVSNPHRPTLRNAGCMRSWCCRTRYCPGSAGRGVSVLASMYTRIWRQADRTRATAGRLQPGGRWCVLVRVGVVSEWPGALLGMRLAHGRGGPGKATQAQLRRDIEGRRPRQPHHHNMNPCPKGFAFVHVVVVWFRHVREAAENARPRPTGTR